LVSELLAVELRSTEQSTDVHNTHELRSVDRVGRPTERQ